MSINRVYVRHMTRCETAHSVTVRRLVTSSILTPLSTWGTRRRILMGSSSAPGKKESVPRFVWQWAKLFCFIVSLFTGVLIAFLAAFISSGNRLSGIQTDLRAPALIAKLRRSLPHEWTASTWRACSLAITWNQDQRCVYDRTEADALAARRDAVQRQSSRRREVSLVLIGRPRLQFPVLIIPRAML